MISPEKAANKGNIHSGEIYRSLPKGMKTKETKYGTFIFSAYECALVERKTGSGAYVYTAINLKTGKTAILSRRKKALTESGFEDMAAKINESYVCGNSRFASDKKPRENTQGSILLETANYIFKDILSKHGYAVRNRQIELTEHILGVIGQRGISLAESEVGTGKTHAYLIAAVLAKRGRLNDFWLRGHYKHQSWADTAYMPVVISTSSIALQEAIVKDYIPELSRILLEYGIIKTPLTAVVRKGKEHYICEERLRRYYSGAKPETKTLLTPFIGSDTPFDLTGVNTLSAHMKRSVCVRDRCGEVCRFRDECRYMRCLTAANAPTVDFQITNHNYFLADRLHRVSGRKPLLPNYQLVIIDEAHKLLDAARTMYSLELTDRELPELAREVHTITMNKSNSGVNVHRLAKKLKEQSEKLFRCFNEKIPEVDMDEEAERFPAVMDGDTGHYLKSISGIASDLATAGANSRVQEIYRERRDKAVWRLTQTAERVSALRKQSKLIYWLENRLEGEFESQVLCAIPKDLDMRLFHDLWSDNIPMILTSGTLSASGDFTRIKETLGLRHLPGQRLFDTTMPSPFDYGRNALLYISESTPFPDSKDKRYIDSVADEIERLVRASHGHAAVLFTSYNAMGQVHAILKNRRLPYPLFRLERGGTHAIEQFKKSGNGILLASGSMWEGIDIPGDALSMLIIIKLPFAVPDPIGDYERSLCGDMEIYKLRVIIPDMLIKLIQGFGRGFRSESDTCVVAILDSRANLRGAYRKWILSALPKCRVTDMIRIVVEFIHEIKPFDYFR